MTRQAGRFDTDVVVIDDDELTLEVLRRTLRGTGIMLLSFSDPARALAHLADHTSGAILIDQRMPCVTGLEVLQEIIADRRHDESRLFLCSAARLPSQIYDTAIDAGADVLDKNVYRDREALLEALVPADGRRTTDAHRAGR